MKTIFFFFGTRVIIQIINKDIGNFHDGKFVLIWLPKLSQSLFSNESRS